MYKTFIIAEIGVNHNGSIDVAMQLIDAAIEAGVDAVKFQTFIAENVISKNAPKAQYQIRNTKDKQETQLEMVKKLELNVSDHELLLNYCDEKGIEFISTPFDLESVKLLVDLGVKRFKIGSGEITNYPYLKMIGELNKDIILSTGMAELGDIEAALNVLIDSGTERQKISLLHATTEYPTQMSDVNLDAMKTMSQAFKLTVGYSDHTLGIEVPTAAVALGARIIEKHFTLDRELPGPDHSASLEPDELKAMVSAIRNIELAIGDGIKGPTSIEIINRPIARKSIVAKNNIKLGEVFTSENITTKRPGTGISPMTWENVLGRKASRAFLADELIEL